MYCYGDATPFSLQYDFIATIRSATDACAALFRTDQEGAERRLHLQRVEAAARRELKQLDHLARDLRASLKSFQTAEPAMGPSDPDRLAITERTAARIEEMSTAALHKARATVSHWRDSALRKINSDLASRVTEIVADFFRCHQLPDSEWTTHWSAPLGGHGTASLLLRTPTALDVSFRPELPPGHLWSRPVRVDALERGLTFLGDHAKAWRVKSREQDIRLDRCFVTEVAMSPDRDAFALCLHRRRPSPSYHVVIRERENALPSVAIVEANGAIGEPTAVADGARAAIEQLWQGIAAAMHTLRKRRSVMTSASFRGTPLEEVKRPAQIAEAILTGMAATVYEIRSRTLRETELAIQRAQGNGHREEIFVTSDELERKFADLPGEYRCIVASAGLLGRFSADGRKSEEFILTPVAANRSATAAPKAAAEPCSTDCVAAAASAPSGNADNDPPRVTSEASPAAVTACGEICREGSSTRRSTSPWPTPLKTLPAPARGPAAPLCSPPARSQQYPSLILLPSTNTTVQASPNHK